MHPVRNRLRGHPQSGGHGEVLRTRVQGRVANRALPGAEQSPLEGRVAQAQSLQALWQAYRAGNASAGDIPAAQVLLKGMRGRGRASVLRIAAPKMERRQAREASGSRPLGRARYQPRQGDMQDVRRSRCGASCSPHQRVRQASGASLAHQQRHYVVRSMPLGCSLCVKCKCREFGEPSA